MLKRARIAFESVVESCQNLMRCLHPKLLTRYPSHNDLRSAIKRWMHVKKHLSMHYLWFDHHVVRFETACRAVRRSSASKILSAKRFKIGRFDVSGFYVNEYSRIRPTIFSIKDLLILVSCFVSYKSIMLHQYVTAFLCLQFRAFGCVFPSNNVLTSFRAPKSMWTSWLSRSILENSLRLNAKFIGKPQRSFKKKRWWREFKICLLFFVVYRLLKQTR